MTQEEKQLLLQDLCARLPYDTIVSVAEGGVDGIKWNKVTLNFYLLHQIEEEDGWEFVKPYLRPMSSMTEEEKEKLKSLYDAENVTNESICFLEGGTLEEYEAEISFIFCYNIVIWLLENHFDFMGLIEKGLALEAPEGMY